jgi:hypothetical protein
MREFTQSWDDHEKQLLESSEADTHALEEAHN